MITATFPNIDESVKYIKKHSFPKRYFIKEYSEDYYTDVLMIRNGKHEIYCEGILITVNDQVIMKETLIDVTHD